MNDPLADLEAMLEDLCTDHQTAEADYWFGPVNGESEFPAFARFSAEWLRANRDRVLEALGGYSAADLTTDARARHQADRNTSVWLFPLGEDQ